jgi:serine protease Do
MSRKQIALWVGGGFVLLLLGSLTGAGLYARFFAPQYVYLQPEPLAATFSRFNGPDTAPRPLPAEAAEAEPSAPLSEVPDFVGAASMARPAVVHIKSRFDTRKAGGRSDFFSNPFRDFFDDEMIEAPQSLASGSGVLISPDGYIATNNHVIQDAASVEVTLFDNRTFSAEVIGTDLSTDLALLKISAEELPHLRFGDSDQVRVGQWVLAVGNPMDLTSTVTAGIVSAKGRNIDLLRNDTQFAIESFIQTDAAVNKGNSGGALVNTQGELVGINTAIASRTGYYAGYSFAIPASITRKVVEDLLVYGEVRRGYLGVSIRPVDANLAEEEHLSILKGAFVTDINPELGAFAAGIRVGDVIVSVNSIQINSSSELQEQVSRYRPGDRVKITLYRGETQVSYQVELRALQTVTRAALRTTLEYRGSVFRLPTEEELTNLDVKHGVMVDQSGDKMSRNGIQKGFVITEVDGSEIHSIEDLEKALLDSGEYITIKGLYSEGMVASYSFNW